MSATTLRAACLVMGSCLVSQPSYGQVVEAKVTRVARLLEPEPPRTARTSSRPSSSARVSRQTVLLPSEPRAQTPEPTKLDPKPGSAVAAADRVRIGVNFLDQQPSSTTFTTTATVPTYLESAAFETTYKVGNGPAFDGGVVIRIRGPFGAGVAVSSFRRTHDAAISGTVPHPFFYDAPRSISGTAPGLKYSELGTHVQLAYLVSNGKVDLSIAGGPSWFHVKQDVVTDVSYADSYPCDVATFSAATVNKATKTQIGFNVSYDVGVRLSPVIGVGVLVRFSRAVVDLTGGNISAGQVTSGGFQVGGGLRLIF